MPTRPCVNVLSVAVMAGVFMSSKEDRMTLRVPKTILPVDLSETMIAQLVEQRVAVTYNLTGAAALAVVMLAVVSIAYAVASRWLGLSRLMSVH